MQSSWRRSLKRIALGFLGLLIGSIVVGSIYEQVARQRVAKEFPPTGKLVDIGGRRIHLDCRGSGAPTVVLESGADTSGSALWFPVQEAVEQFARVCSYDRAGLMWSDPVDEPRTGADVATDLHKALQAANERGPYVMVGASLGGPYVMIFTQHFGSEVAGVVFVDAAHPEQTRRTEEASGLASDESVPLVFRLLARLAWTGLPRLLLPSPSIPELPTHVAEAIGAYQPTSLRSAFDEAARMESTFQEAGILRNLGDRPLAVLTRGKPWSAYSEAQRAGAGMTREQFDRTQAAWWAMQDEEATWSTQSTHRRLDDSSHVIQLERPDAVIAAIREVVEMVRAQRSAAGGHSVGEPSVRLLRE